MIALAGRPPAGSSPASSDPRLTLAALIVSRQWKQVRVCQPGRAVSNWLIGQLLQQRVQILSSSVSIIACPPKDAPASTLPPDKHSF